MNPRQPIKMSIKDMRIGTIRRFTTHHLKKVWLHLPKVFISLSMDKLLTTQHITPEDLEAIRQAKQDMEQLGWAIRNINKIGNAMEAGFKYIPPKALALLQKSTEKALMAVVKANLMTIEKDTTFRKPSNRAYKALVTGSGAVSGFFGSTTGIGTVIFASEIALTTKFMMRTILDIARSEGEDIYALEAQMACLEVFALGGASKDDDGTESSYYATRMALSSSLKKVTASSIHATLDALVKSSRALGSNALHKFVSKIATRLSVVFSEKVMAQAVPVIGAAGGGTLNYIFIDHFQKMASAHFKIRRLERRYGEALVKAAYDAVALN